jgi:membrane protein YqaA with SNARE-associated domain
MWWAYALVFFGAIIVDITPLPLPPAFTLMIILQASFNLAIWPVIILGVAGSAIGRYLFSLYIPHLSAQVLKPEKIEDIRYLGNKINTSSLRSQLFTLGYTLLPISSTPLFITAGIARLKPVYIIPAFIVGKTISDSIAVMMGKYAVKNTDSLLSGMYSVESVLALLVFIVLILALMFIDWRTWIMHSKIKLRFKIWKKSQ